MSQTLDKNRRQIDRSYSVGSLKQTFAATQKTGKVGSIETFAVPCTKVCTAGQNGRWQMWLVFS